MNTIILPLNPRPLVVGCLGLALMIGMSCQPVPPEDFEFVPETPHEAYEYAFRKLGLETTAMGREWIMSGQSALEQAATVNPPFQEVGFFEPRVVQARGFRFAATRGQRIVVNVANRHGVGEVFIDLFRVVDSPRPFRHLMSADSGAVRIDVPVSRSDEYLVRIQPELLSDGEFEITITLAASLAFPVEGHGPDAIRSVFGASRDGGRREHHGVDIFAPRGTPVLASAEGRISSTRSNRLGGNVVWLRTEFGSLYHAHLDSIAVRRGLNVTIGDTLGFVGNSGNARTTPPHLHFGIYARRPTDPGPFIRPPPQTPPRLRGDRGLLRRVVRSTREIRLPGEDDDVGMVVWPSGVPMIVLAVTGEAFRVLLPDGVTRHVPVNAVVDGDRPVRTFVSESRQSGRRYVLDEAVRTMRVTPGDSLSVLGEFDGQLFVRDAEGVAAWVRPVNATDPR